LSLDRPGTSFLKGPWSAPVAAALPPKPDPPADVNIHDLKVAYEKAIGHETSKSTV
jgi:hypothetical protein